MVLELEPEHISKTSLTDLVTKWMGVLGRLHWELDPEVAQDPEVLLPDSENSTDVTLHSPFL